MSKISKFYEMTNEETQNINGGDSLGFVADRITGRQKEVMAVGTLNAYELDESGNFGSSGKQYATTRFGQKVIAQTYVNRSTGEKFELVVSR